MMCCYSFVFFFFFKQKTAYEMRISDWSSDVCSSDLPEPARPRLREVTEALLALLQRLFRRDLLGHVETDAAAATARQQIVVGLDPPSLAGLGAEGGMLGERIGRRPRADRALVARQHGELVAVERELHELQDRKGVV